MHVASLWNYSEQYIRHCKYYDVIFKVILYDLINILHYISAAKSGCSFIEWSSARVVCDISFEGFEKEKAINRWWYISVINTVLVTWVLNKVHFISYHWQNLPKFFLIAHKNVTLTAQTILDRGFSPSQTATHPDFLIVHKCWLIFGIPYSSSKKCLS